MPTSLCPHLGLAGDHTLVRTTPSTSHRCYAQTPAGAPDEAYQQRYCFTADHGQCPFFRPPDAITTPAGADDAAASDQPATWSVGRLLYIAVLAVVLVIVIVVYARSFFLPSPPALATPPAFALATPTLSPSPTAPALAPTVAVATNRLSTPTPEPGGRVVAVSPRAGDAGWWTNAEERRNHLGDSFLYAGYFQAQVFISAIRFDLSNIPRGAPLREVVLQLTGLNTDRFAASVGGNWSVSLLSADAIPELARADFQTLLNASAAVTLVPALSASDLSVGGVNFWQLDPSARSWLERQWLDGKTEIIARITGPVGGRDSLFAWDSGAGPATGGTPPQLILALGPPPATIPPLPTEALVVATLTPTPANVLTVAANVLTATAVATTTGTYTPGPAHIATPTPIPANLATVQAIALLLGEAPVVEHTPTPANLATATADALYATAVAITTGTFTPIPRGAVTPAYVTPTATPANLATAVAHVLTATAQAGLSIIPTPRPYNALVITPTWTPFAITATPTPATDATATAHAFYATAVALTTGTITPLPLNATVVGGQPAATPAPAVFQVGDVVTISAKQRANLRRGPGVNFATLSAIDPGATVEIIGGPQPSGAYTWWLVRHTNANGDQVEGWIADLVLAPAS